MNQSIESLACDRSAVSAVEASGGESVLQIVPGKILTMQFETQTSTIG
jgi:hypothetical protein